MSQEAVEILIRYIIDGCKKELELYLSMDINNHVWFNFKDGSVLSLLWDGRFNLVLMMPATGIVYESISIDIADIPSVADISILSTIMLREGIYAKEVS